MPDEMQPIINKAIDTGFNIFANGIYSKWAEAREHEARQENYNLNEMSAYYADKRARQMYEDYMTPEARLKMYKEAGLSPSLMFGDGAAAPQPTQGAQGQGVAGISPQVFGSVSTSMVAENAERLAEARLKNVQADTIEGKNKRGQNEIERLVGQVAYQGLVNEAAEWDNTRRSLEVNLLASYGEEEIKSKLKNLGANTDVLLQKLRSETVAGNIAEKTEKDVVEKIHTENLQALANLFKTQVETQLAKSNIKLNEKQLENLASLMSFRSGIIRIQDEKIYMDYSNALRQISIEEKKYGLERDKFEWQQYKDIVNTMQEVLTFGVKNGLFGKATTIGFH